MAEPRNVTLAVIGAGPKGVSLLAKRASLEKVLEHELPSIAVFDHQGIGSNWSGDSGYTDGDQKIVNPVDQDVGHPYLDTLEIKGVAKEMLRFSLPHYIVHEERHSDWVLSDRRIEHREFAKYLRWVLREADSETPVIDQRVSRLSLTGDHKWLIQLANGSEYQANGLVVTGNGVPIEIKGGPNSWRLMNGKSFWERCKKLKSVIKSSESIVIIGAGETAGAIAAQVLRLVPPNARVHLIRDQGTFYSRGQSFGETIWFSNPESTFQELKWLDLSPDDRREIIQRADRGVVSIDTKQLLERHAQVTHVVGRVDKISLVGKELVLSLSYDGKDKDPEVYNYVINALGFDHLWFLHLMDAATRRILVAHLAELDPLKAGDELFDLARDGGKTGNKMIPWIAAHSNDRPAEKWIKKVIEENIERDLSIAGFKPNLHLPMLSGFSQGPGFPNLNCLGLMSDRIWKSYL